MMVTILCIAGIILLMGGIAGCFLPVLPGPPLCFLALLIQNVNETPPFEKQFLWIWGGIAVTVTALDYVIPMYSTKKFGGSKFGIWGCGIGLLGGIWLGPIGIIIGPLVGAFAGELINNLNPSRAFRSAMGSFIGFLAGTLLKLAVCLAMCGYFARFVYTLIVR